MPVRLAVNDVNSESASGLGRAIVNWQHLSSHARTQLCEQLVVKSLNGDVQPDLLICNGRTVNLCTHFALQAGSQRNWWQQPVPPEQAPVVERNTSVRVVLQDNSQPLPPLLARALCLTTHICVSVAAAALAASHTTIPGEQAAVRARLCAAGVLCLRRTHSLTSCSWVLCWSNRETASLSAACDTKPSSLASRGVLRGGRDLGSSGQSAKGKATSLLPWGFT